MRWVRAWWIRLIGTFGRRNHERDLAAELESHLQFHIDDNIRAGMTPEEARRQAILALGGLEQTKEGWRDQRGFPLIEQVLQDTRYAARLIRKKPGLFVAAVLGLGLAIGVSTAGVALLHGVLVRPAPLEAPGELVGLFVSVPGQDRWRDPVSGPRFREWRARADVFADMAASSARAFALMLNGVAERVEGELVSTNFFDVLAPHVLLGRPVTAADREWQHDAIPCVISERLWRTHFAGSPDVLGRTVDAGETLTIVGVVPESVARWRTAVTGASRPVSIWVPYELAPTLLSPAILHADGYRLFRVTGRLAPGVGIDMAQEVMTSLDAQIDEVLGGAEPESDVAVVAMKELTVEPVTRRSLWLVGCTLLLLLALASANVASQLAARGIHRRRELATRAALGASRGRLIRQLLIESAVLASAGGILGLLIATWAVPVFLVLAPPAVARTADVAIDGIAYVFVGIAVATITLAITALPALQICLKDARARLREAAGSTAPLAGLRSQRLLVAGQMVIVMPLAAVAVLLVSSFVRLQGVDVGLPDAQAVLTMRLDVPEPERRTPEALRAFHDALLEATASLPAVESVAISNSEPVDYLQPNPRDAGVSISIEDGRRFLNGNAEDAPFTPTRRRVSSAYFDAVGVRIVAGRGFSETDRIGATPVAVINETMARLHWPGEDPIGRRVNFGSVRPGRPLEEPWTVVIGVVADARQYRYDAPPRPEVYTPTVQAAALPSTWTLMLRTALPPEALAPAVRQVVADIQPAVAVYNVRTLASIVSEATATRRYATTLVGLFAVAALVLAALGVHGLGSFAAAQRLKEIGIRRALGATDRDIARTTLLEAIRPAVAGVLIGALVAAWAVRLVRALLYETDTADPVLFGASTVGLLLVAGVAAYLPARRATRVDPMLALRTE